MGLLRKTLTALLTAAVGATAGELAAKSWVRNLGAYDNKPVIERGIISPHLRHGDRIVRHGIVVYEAERADTVVRTYGDLGHSQYSVE